MKTSRHGIVAVACLDVRRRPGHREEMTSQLLMGEVVRVLSAASRNLWVRVENLADGYRGWVRTWGLLETDARGAASWTRAARARVSAHHVVVREGRGRGATIAPLLWHSRVVPLGGSGAWRRVGLPDGQSGWIAARAVAAVRRSGARLNEVVGSLMGVPYLWGGRTPMGFDCSGFVQQVMEDLGISLPRDADDQWRSVRRLSRRERPRRGDLVFFGPPGRRVPHVGIILSGGAYAHSRGCVRINSLDSGNALYDNLLGQMVRGVGRCERVGSRVDLVGRIPA